MNEPNQQEIKEEPKTHVFLKPCGCLACAVLNVPRNFQSLAKAQRYAETHGETYHWMETAVVTELIPRILDGTKTETRRVIKPQPRQFTGKDINRNDQTFYDWIGKGKDSTRPYSKEPPVVVSCGEWLFKHRIVQFCPYGQVGDRLWVREKALYWDGGAAGRSAVVYADDPEIPHLLEDNNRLLIPRTLSNIETGENIVGKWVWKPSIHMYKEDSRITLEITGIRVERLQEINTLDIIKEGIRVNGINPEADIKYLGALYSAFVNLWNSLNAKRGHPWENNDWVWVIDFKRIEEE